MSVFVLQVDCIYCKCFGNANVQRFAMPMQHIKIENSVTLVKEILVNFKVISNKLTKSIS